MSLRLLLLLSILIGTGAHLAAFEFTDRFVAHMKATTNPHGFGLRDQRYFPYSTRYGRRIGFGRPVTDTALYRRGETPAEAEQALRQGLSLTLVHLRTALARTHPTVVFDALDRRAQEILLDHAYTEGVEHLPPAFLDVVLQADWDRLLDQHLYIRGLGNWPDTIKNQAFGKRWIYGDPATVLRPLKGAPAASRTGFIEPRIPQPRTHSD